MTALLVIPVALLAALLGVCIPVLVVRYALSDILESTVSFAMGCVLILGAAWMSVSLVGLAAYGIWEFT